MVDRPDAPWQCLSVFIGGTPDGLLAPPEGYSIDVNVQRDPDMAPSYVVRRYFDDDTHLEPELIALALWAERTARPHGCNVRGINMYARVTDAAPGFGATLGPAALAAMHRLGGFLDVSVYVSPT